MVYLEVVIFEALNNGEKLYVSMEKQVSKRGVGISWVCYKEWMFGCGNGHRV